MNAPLESQPLRATADGSNPTAGLPQLAPRNAESHKGDFGRALLVGGSLGMTGAISLCGMAALRSGAGLVQLAVPRVCQATVATFEPSYMTAGVDHDKDGRIAATAGQQLRLLAAEATAVACGPGLGRSEELDELVSWLYADLSQPALFDADALNALAQRRNVLPRGGGVRILTPHPGEFRRLLDNPQPLTRQEAEQEAVALAAQWRSVIVLKGHRTFVTDGEQSSHNTTGNPGMATGGTGDVLSGVITALLCQGLTAFDAARLGVYLHGLAGDLAAEDLGQVSLIASDLLDYLPDAFESL